MSADHQIYLLLGSNLEQPEVQLKSAIKLLETKAGRIVKKSSRFLTQAWGYNEQPDFLNQVILMHTSLCAEECLQIILSIEKEMGRTRTTPNAPRKIDIDILFFDDLILDKSQLKIPHPEIANRKFVLVPLNEIAPRFIHPVHNKPISELLAICTDNLNVSKM